MMKQQLLSLLIFFSAFISASAQSVRTPVSATYTSLGAYSRHQADVFSWRSNQAALAGVTSFTAGVYSERRFMLQELSFYNFAAAMPTASGNIGIRGAYFGNLDFNEASAGLAYARSLGEKVSVGVQFNYFSMRAGAYGSAAAVNFEAGVIYNVSDQLRVGLHTYNPTTSKIGKGEEEKLPAIYSLGIGYDASEKFFISTTIEKEENKKLNVNGGFQYKPSEVIVTRAGFSSGTSSYYLGAGVIIKNIRIDATATLHPHLGVTPGLMFIYQSMQ